jgi:PadR family transcriptional regulator PadR
MPMTHPTIETQNLTKSSNEALILASLARGPKHGYQLALDIEERSRGVFRFNHGTLYPILHKLEKDGLIEGEWSGEDGGRRRRSYRLSERGRHVEIELISQWRAFVDRFFEMLGGDRP